MRTKKQIRQIEVKGAIEVLSPLQQKKHIQRAIDKFNDLYYQLSIGYIDSNQYSKLILKLDL